MPVTLNSVLQVLIFLVIVLLLTKPIGLYMTTSLTGSAPGSRRSLSPSSAFSTGSVASTRRRSRSGRATSSPC